MSLPVFLGPVTDVEAGETVLVTGDEARHAVVVRRTRVGEHVVLVDGSGTRATCQVVDATPSTLEVLVTEVTSTPRPVPEVTVVQAIPKGDRGELAVEVLTEVGADRIVPWAAARCVGVWRGERAARSLAKWRATARESAKQSRRAWLPEVTDQLSTPEVATLLAEADLAVVLHEAATDPLAALDLEGASSLAVVVGPEGGLTDEELAAFTEAGARVTRMGDSVLRTSTAGVAALGAVLSRTARWG